MKDVTKILAEAADGDSGAAGKLLPLVYEELRCLARSQLSSETPGQTLNATALVHEAYLRLVGEGEGPAWDNRGHFFAAAAESMRRILVENARRKSRLKHGGGRERVELEDRDGARWVKPNQVLEVNEALDRLYEEDELAAQVVKLSYFAGLTVEEAANALDISRANAYRHWKFARAWMQCEMKRESQES